MFLFFENHFLKNLNLNLLNLPVIQLVQSNLTGNLKMLEQEIEPKLLDDVKERQKWIKYKEKDILYEDYSNLTGKEIAKRVPIFSHLELKLGKKDMLLIIDLSNSYANDGAVKAFTEAGKQTEDLFSKTAVLGITGVKKILLNVVNRLTNVNAKPFSHIEDAKEYLIK